MTQTALTPQQSFEEKVKDRLRENIGDLMPDEVLAEMVKKAMDEMFFTRREKRTNDYYGRTEVFPSWFEEEVSGVLKQRVLDEVKVAVEAKREELHEIASKLIIEQLPNLVVAVLVGFVEQIASGRTYAVQSQILDMLRSKGFAV